MTGPTLTAGTVPVGPMLSMYDPIHIGGDEFGQPVAIRIIYRNLLAAGEPGGGKSGLLNTLAAHTALSVNSRLVLFDGKQVELGMWDDIADEFVGPDIGHAIITLLRSAPAGAPSASPPPPWPRPPSPARPATANSRPRTLTALKRQYPASPGYTHLITVNGRAPHFLSRTRHGAGLCLPAPGPCLPTYP